MSHFRLIDIARSVEDYAIRQIKKRIDLLEALVVRFGEKLQQLEDELDIYTAARFGR